VRWVVKNGDVYDASTLTREWPSKEELPKFYWAE
jgi:hypothetical protein